MKKIKKAKIIQGEGADFGNLQELSRSLQHKIVYLSFAFLLAGQPGPRTLPLSAGDDISGRKKLVYQAVEPANKGEGILQADPAASAAAFSWRRCCCPEAGGGDDGGLEQEQAV